ncbi:Asp-tRNA(Asn)/Glu-tRNA(Gln) amidotransferase subunit GatC [Helicobacter ailurogastricus]|uniref:Aspartyl/glutamyl-tRNA(Asn/Gln) amidotransferase subunit C n=1 Tax=Helicobacter ailurogastricus TaxID=1578720 RepID=A0A0K2XE03_9HELI|nr:Asp-tRNA(Asn)/Glu-tRNA(Gln) amidotransferase subunit GatC [Helicobacter ailurogastricus]CRF41486.1 Aspartyl-tRNA(Asn) amidotransferase subunit C @ Glutamyl-tRNA(Gln) amidotransferase subunit C [Helicobacter ailurogastricus]CRF42954.1 Aspartyl-tRNA(Asn) amidotransferase subunit C @ Glutamyl-tRNA(Gln) amidotransferase subunit C [Helicobacter ailurogastricus]CRF43683.1 Aspartyl-tRNA(Asn) amidotransferase subunit C @ Glutamyl-tRNA(Gln) amidotransferase subunit C [Helicobacter ailurogastricus]CRF
MQIDNALLDKLATLSMLEITPKECEELRGHLKEVLEFVDLLNEMDLSGVQPHQSAPAPLRADTIIHDSQISKDLLKQAPKAQDGYFIVPKIIET